MKKIIGILFLVLGLTMIGLGIASLVELDSRDKSIEGKFSTTFSEDYHQDNDELGMLGLGLNGGGILFFVLGIVLLATKSRREIENEVELKLLKQNQGINTPSIPIEENLSNLTFNQKLNQLERLGKLKEQGLISEEEFQVQKNKILE